MRTFVPPFGDFNADGTNYDYPNGPAFGSNIPHSRGDFQKGVFTKSDFPLPPPGVSGSLGRKGLEMRLRALEKLPKS